MASRRSASPIKILFLLLTLTLASPLARSARAASQQAKDSNPDATSQRSLSAMLRQRRSTRPEVGATYESVDDYPSLRSQLPVRMGALSSSSLKLYRHPANGSSLAHPRDALGAATGSHCAGAPRQEPRTVPAQDAL